MYYAVSYYPEFYEEDRLEKDIVLMKELGINAVRTGEFAWSLFEPSEGIYDFSWLDRVIDRLGQEGIMTVIGTPTASLPKWLTDKHPDTCQTDLSGKKRPYGLRRNPCVNSKNFRKYSRNITRKIAEHYKDNKYVIAYQIDNELMAGDPYCYCEECREKFRSTMKARYGTIENLNKQWGMDFWSLTFPSFDSIELHAPGQPSLLKNFYEFTSDCFIEFCTDMANTIREVDSEKIITTNLCSSGFLYRMDLQKLYSALDITSLDLYPMYRLWREYDTAPPQAFDLAEVSFALALTRSYRGEHFWLTEKETPRIDNPAQYNLVTLTELAAGARMFSAFEWRKKTIGFEQGHPSILPYNGKAGESYRLFGQVLKLIEKCSEVKNSLPIPQVAIVRDFQSDFSFMAKSRAGFKYLVCLYEFYRAVTSLGLNCDIIMPDADFSKYKAVIVPARVNIESGDREKIESYVKGGGKYITTIHSALRDRENRVIAQSQPCFINDILGIEVEDTLKSAKMIKMSDTNGRIFDADQTFDVVNINDARAVFMFEHENTRKTPAVTRKTTGKGEAWYFACLPSQEALESVLADILNFIPTELKSVQGSVQIIRTADDKNEWYFVINKGKDTAKIKTDVPMCNILTEEKVSGEAVIEGMGYLVLRKM